MSKGILALLKQDANIISAIIKDSETNNEYINSNVEEENKNILEASRNEENNGVEIRGGTEMNGTIEMQNVTVIESESQHKLVQSFKFLKPPCALGYQSENVDKMRINLSMIFTPKD